MNKMHSYAFHYCRTNNVDGALKFFTDTNKDSFASTYIDILEAYAKQVGVNIVIAAKCSTINHFEVCLLLSGTKGSSV